MLAGSDVETVKRLIENQQVRLSHQRLAEQRFARFAGREIFKAAIEQMSDTKLLRQRRAAGRVFHLVLNDFRRGSSGILFARTEHIGVITLPFIADQFLQLLEGETGYP